MSLSASSRFRVLGPVASGGMGSVDLALASEPNGTPRVVALKRLHAHLVGEQRMIESLLDEARIASRLFHANIVRVSDVEMIEDDVVLVMDYVEGISLAAFMRWHREQNRPMSVAVANLLVRDMLRGLHAAHELRDESGALLGVIHRDVSPQNVIVGVDGVARLTDFGVAKARGRIANTKTEGPVKGKLRYLAPEQIYRKPIDRRVDVFAAGIVLWECLAGRRLFDGVTEGETLAHVLTAPIEPPSTHRFEIPLELDEICMRALERDEKRRWSTADEFANALETTKLADRAEVAPLVATAGAEQIERLRALVREGESRVSAKRSVPASAVAASAASASGAPSPPRSRRGAIGIAAAVVASAVAGGVITNAYSARTRPAPSATIASSTPVAVASTTPSPSERATTAAPPVTVADVTTAASAVASAPASKDTRPPTRRKSRPKGDGGAGVPAFDPDDL